MNLQIPDKFKSILERNQKYLGNVLTTLDWYGGVIRNRKPEFFPDYTDHGIEHIQSVLNSTEWLTGESIELLSEKDVAAIVLSVLLHDYGMFLTYDGLITLLESEEKIEFFDKKTWKELWAEFESEVRRWDDKKQIDVCGKKVDCNIILDGDLRDSTKRIIGEFLRRHHPRLAHEIALNGFPGVNGSRIEFANGIDDDLKDIAGLVARSHGMNLRDTFSYIQRKFGVLRDPYSVKAIYLMTLLRIADYLQFTNERAPKDNLSTYTIPSPFSRLQWSIHNAVLNTTHNGNDPELINVVARPKTVKEYLELESLFKGIQYELDHSWAVLGEVYGENKELSKLKIRIRRIKSTLEDEEFKSELPYLPKEILFESHPDVVKLLIQPLYGDDPSFGVRELLQNSLDACRERMRKESQKGNNYEPDIHIEIDNNGEDYFFKIYDNGMGMSEEIISNYFFKVGSTYRNSLDWKRDFTDSDGLSTVQRSGKFGVGVLAAFLLGDEIYVETKRLETKESGYSFSARIDDRAIEIKKEKGLKPGTLIQVKMNKKTINELSSKNGAAYGKIHWANWFKLSFPKINIKIPDNWNINTNNKLEIERETSKVKGWYYFKSKEFPLISWTFDLRGSILLCNGIQVPRVIEKRGLTYPTFLQYPSLSIIDPNGKLPLSLSRNELTDKLPFESKLSTEVCKKFIWELLNTSYDNNRDSFQDNLQKKGFENSRIINFSSSLEFMAGYKGSLKWAHKDILLTKNGYIFPHQHCIKKAQLNKLVIIIEKSRLNRRNEMNLKYLLPPAKDSCAYCLTSGRKFRDQYHNMNNFISAIFEHNVISIDEMLLSCYEKRIYVKHQFVPGYFYDGIPLKQDVIGNVINDRWATFSTDRSSISEVDMNQLEDGEIDMIIELDILNPPEVEVEITNENDMLLPLLEYYLGDDVIIPYSIEERKKRYPKVFEELVIYS